MFGLGSSILAGGLTLSLLVLPNVVVASQEAIKAVPNYLREASYGLGATKVDNGAKSRIAISNSWHNDRVNPCLIKSYW